MFDKDDEAARIDFEHGARLGGVVAKREAIKLNPYAQLCNQMVTQAMQAHQSCTAAAEPPEKPSRWFAKQIEFLQIWHKQETFTMIHKQLEV